MIDEFEKWVRWTFSGKNKDIVPGQSTTWTRGQVTTTSSLANPTSGATRWTIILISFSDNENHPNISITSEYVLVRCIFYIFLATPTTQKGKKAFATIPLPEHPVGISMCSMSRFFPFLEVNSELQLEGRQHWPLKRKKSLYQNAQYSDVQHEQIFTFAWNTDMSELRIAAGRNGWQRWPPRGKNTCAIILFPEHWFEVRDMGEHKICSGIFSPASSDVNPT